jgi:hypothetical protein
MAYDNVLLTALLHDLGTLHRRARPDEAADHAAAGAAFLRTVLAPRLTALLSPADLDAVADGIAGHHAQPSVVAEADALASGLPAGPVDPVAEQPDAPHRQAVSCPLCAAPGPDRTAQILLPARVELSDALMPRLPAAGRDGSAESARESARDSADDFAEAYQRLLSRLTDEAAALPNGSLPAFTDSLIALLERHTALVPAPRGGLEPTVSLFDHLKWTAAFAEALQAGAAQTGSFESGSFSVLGLRLAEPPTAPAGHRALPIAAGRAEAELFLRAAEHHLRAAMRLSSASVMVRTGRELVLLTADVPETRSAWEAASARVVEAAAGRFGLTLSVQTAAVSRGRGGLSPFGPAYVALRAAWDEAAARPAPRIWADPAVWSAAPVQAAPAGAALPRPADFLIVRDLSGADGAGTDAALSVPLLGVELRTELRIEDDAGPVPTAAPSAPGDFARTVLVGPRRREWSVLPEAMTDGVPVAFGREPSPVLGGGGVPPEMPAARSLFAVVCDRPFEAWESPDDPPAAFTALGRRLDLYFRGLAGFRAAERGGTVVSADRTGLAVAAAVQSAPDLVARVQADFVQYCGGRAVALSAALAPAAPEITVGRQMSRASDGLLAAESAGGDRLWFDGVLLGWVEFLDLRRVAEDLLAAPVRERRLRAGFLAELSRAGARPGFAPVAKRLPARLPRLLARATGEAGLLGALGRQLGRAATRLPVLARLAGMALGQA